MLVTCLVVLAGAPAQASAATTTSYTFVYGSATANPTTCTFWPTVSTIESADRLWVRGYTKSSCDNRAPRATRVEVAMVSDGGPWSTYSHQCTDLRYCYTYTVQRSRWGWHRYCAISHTSYNFLVPTIGTWGTHSLPRFGEPGVMRCRWVNGY